MLFRSRQSLAIARALVGDPPIMLLDEPTSAMDIAGERALIERLKVALKGRTVLVITHRATLLELADTVIVVEGGKVVARGPKASVLAPPPAAAAAARQGGAPQ